jgi:CHAD domain-containing protein
VVGAVTREIERKLSVHALFDLPDLTASDCGVDRVEVLPERDMTATYFDTEDLRLFRSRITLRRRTGGPDEGWHLKLPVDGAGAKVRDEILLPLEDLRADAEVTVPWEFLDLTTAFTRGQRLVEVATLRTARSPLRLFNSAGDEIAELVDDTVSILDGTRVAERFREIEIESRGEDPGLIDAVAAALIEVGAIPGETSKAARALGPAASGPPDVPPASPLLPMEPAGEVMRALIQRNVRLLMAHDIRLRQDLPDAVHQMRVAARRMRSGLKSLPLLHKESAGHLQSELSWLAGELGDYRDAEVRQARIQKIVRVLDDSSRQRTQQVLAAVLDQQLAVGRQQALDALRSIRYTDLLDTLVTCAQEPPFNDEAGLALQDVLPSFVQSAFTKLQRKVKSLDIEGPPDSWHAVRISAKHARYAVDAVAPALGAPARKRATALAQVTNVLGAMNDCTVTSAFIDDQARDIDDPEIAYALGVLSGQEQAAARSHRKEFLRLWPDIRRTHRKNELLQ